MFEVYRHEFELDGVKYSILPASGEHLGLFYSVLDKLKDVGDGKISFDEDTAKKLHSFTLEIFKKSYPQEPVEKLDLFVSKHLLKLLEHIVKVSL